MAKKKNNGDLKTGATIGGMIGGTVGLITTLPTGGFGAIPLGFLGGAMGGVAQAGLSMLGKKKKRK